MQTPAATLPVTTSVAEGEPSVRLVPRLAAHRRNRGLIDILSVAAVLALLLGGSWVVWNDRSAAPTPGGSNGIAGVSTPEHGSTPESDDGLTVALNQLWVENLASGELTDVAPVNTTDCTTPSRPAGSLAAAVAERESLGDAAPTIESEFVPGAGIEPTEYSAGSAEDVAAASAFFRQVSACRFATGDREGTALLPYTGAYWNLYSNDAFNFDQVFPSEQTATEAVNQQYSYISSYVDAWSYPAKVTDVREVPADAMGRPRLLVSTVGIYPADAETISLLVQEDGHWRFLVTSLDTPSAESDPFAQVVDVWLGRDQYGPHATGNFSGRLEADRPVAMTLANVGATPQRVSVGGQDLGVVQPGASLVLQPFRVRPDTVASAGGRFTFTVESVDPSAATDAAARPLTIAVYPPGSLGPGGEFVGTATPVVDGTPAAAG